MTVLQQNYAEPLAFSYTYYTLNVGSKCLLYFWTQKKNVRLYLHINVFFFQMSLYMNII